jgi:hypothetical protein
MTQGSPLINHLLIVNAILIVILFYQMLFSNPNREIHEISLHAKYHTSNPDYRIMPSPQPMPSIKTSIQEENILSIKRDFYGGAGDKQHLGNFNSHPSHYMIKLTIDIKFYRWIHGKRWIRFIF